MASSRRPQRSTRKNVSYKDLLKLPDLSSPESEGEDGGDAKERPGTSKTAKAKGKRKRVVFEEQSDDDDDDEESAYDPGEEEEVGEEVDEDEEVVPTDEEDDDGRPDRGDQFEDMGDTLAWTDEPPPTSSKPKAKLKPTARATALSSLRFPSAPDSTGGRKSTSSGQGKSLPALRPQFEGQMAGGGGKRTPSHLMTYGPIDWPDVRIELSSSGTGVEGGGDTVRIEEAGSMDEAERQRYFVEASSSFVGPSWDRVFDVGWWKGKWEAIKPGRREVGEWRWGGWYDGIAIRFDGVEDLEGAVMSYKRMSDEEVKRYIPRLIHPARPSPILRPSSATAPSAPSDQGVTDGTSMDVDSDPVVHHGRTDEPEPETELEPEESEDNDGSISCLFGPVVDEGGKEVGQENVRFERFQARRLDEFFENKPGHVFNAGGPVHGLDWCPLADLKQPQRNEYLAISTISSSPLISGPPPSEDPPSSSSSSRGTRSTSAVRPGMVQIWSLDCGTAPDSFRRGSGSGSGSKVEGEGRRMRFELGLCTDLGEAWMVRWCPRGGAFEEFDKGGTQRLGIVAGAFTGGSIGLFAVPRPDTVRRETGAPEDETVILKAERPLLKLELVDTACWCLDWASHETIAAGCMNGWMAVWFVGDAIRSGARTVAPTHYFRVHDAAIRQISWMRYPPCDGDANIDGGAEPTQIMSAGWDGSFTLTDVRDPGSARAFVHERSTAISCGFSGHTGGGLIADADNDVRYISLRASSLGVKTALSAHKGPVLGIAGSDLHTYVASVGTDGSCLIVNAIRRMKKKSHIAHFIRKIFRVDFSRQIGMYRMIENVLPEERPAESLPTIKSKKGKNPGVARGLAGIHDSSPVFSFPREIAVRCVAWHGSIRRAGLLGSGTAMGLVRVDWCDAPAGYEDGAKDGSGGRGQRGRKVKDEEGEEDEDEDEPADDMDEID